MLYNTEKSATSRLWMAGIILLTVVTIWLLLGNFILHKDERIKSAIESGQRFEISLKTGEISGRVPMLEEKEVATPQAEVLSTQENINNKPALDENAAAIPQAEAKTEDPLAWMGQDFIGPRLPDNAIKALLSSDLSPAVNRISVKDISAKPVVVIIIKDVGLNVASIREVMELPKEINIGFSAYTASLDEWTKKVKETGHEIVLNIPMESPDSQLNKPGQYSMLNQGTDAENVARLKEVLALTSTYSALYSENNEIFSKIEGSIKPVIEALKKENKYFIYGGGYTNNQIVQISDSLNYPVLVNDLVLDDDISSAAVTQKFAELEKIANEKGYVVAMAHPYPATLSILETWLQTAAQKKLLVSPVSLLLGKRLK